MTIDVVAETDYPTVEPYFMDKYAVDSPMVVVSIIAIYLLIILKIAPSYMKSRPAYDLKTFMIVYNVLQVFACIYLVYKIIVIDSPTLRFWKCESFLPGSAAQRDFNQVSIFTFWLKVIELSETVVFVLRKKQRQVSFLHVFHHCATMSLVYMFFKTYKSSAALYPLFLNCNVHIVMYLYYLLAAVVPASVIPKLTPLKKAITTVQIVQFALILTQVVAGISLGCKVPTALLMCHVCIICAFFYMFYDFYKKNYSAKSESATAARKKRESSKPTAGGH